MICVFFVVLCCLGSTNATSIFKDLTPIITDHLKLQSSPPSHHHILWQRLFNILSSLSGTLFSTATSSTMFNINNHMASNKAHTNLLVNITTMHDNRLTNIDHQLLNIRSTLKILLSIIHPITTNTPTMY